MILTLEALAPEIERRKKEGQRVVLANGCFEIPHVGHLRYLQGAKALGDCLVVAVNGDDSVRGLKGAGRPLVPAEDRAEIVDALACVDYVTIFDEPSVANVLRALRPHVHAKGTDYSPETVPERDVAASVGARVAITGDPKGHSTTDLIARIRSRARPQ